MMIQAESLGGGFSTLFSKAGEALNAMKATGIVAAHHAPTIASGVPATVSFVDDVKSAAQVLQEATQARQNLAKSAAMKAEAEAKKKQIFFVGGAVALVWFLTRK